MRLTIAQLIIFLVGSTLPLAGNAQNYPERPIRLIVPFAPGGTSDIVGRLVGTKLGEELGQTVVVDNRGGAGATLGTGLAARAQADGYTLIISHSGLAINETLYSKLSYTAVKDFSSISLVGAAPAAVVVNNALPAKSMQDLVALAKKRPGELNYGSGGVGSAGHLSVALLEFVAGLKFTHIPFKGGAPSVMATISGEVNFAIPTLPTAATHAKAGRLRMLAVTGAKRSSAAPDVPTVAEAAVPNYVYETWFGVFAPSGTPKSILDRLNQAVVKVIATQELQNQLSSQGLEPYSSTPAQLDKLLRDDIATWAKTIKAAGIPTN